MLAHLVERDIRIVEASGSSPLHSTKLVIKNPPEKKLSGIFVFFAVARPPWGSVFVFLLRTGHLHLQRPVRTSLSRF